MAKSLSSKLIHNWGYVTVNQTDGLGVKKENIQTIRAIWVDDDNQREFARTDWPIEPTVVVESSPGKFHYYWRLAYMAGMNDQTFRGVMMRLVADWDHDKQAVDVARVMRLPGFFHCKHEPFMSHIVSISNANYSVNSIVMAFPPIFEAPVARVDRETGEMIIPTDNAAFWQEVRDALFDVPMEFCDERKTWLDIGMGLNHQFGEAGFPLWDDWSQQSKKYDPANLRHVWNSFSGKGIGNITIRQVFHCAYGGGYLSRFPISDEMAANMAIMECNMLARQQFTQPSTIPAPANGSSLVWQEPDRRLITPYTNTPPVIDCDIFPEPIKHWLREASEEQNAPLDFVAANFIVASASLIGMARSASPWKGWVEPTILRVGNVGGPALGKRQPTGRSFQSYTKFRRSSNLDGSWSTKTGRR